MITKENCSSLSREFPPIYNRFHSLHA